MTLPDFTGDRVNAYISIKDTAAWIKYLKRAFPNQPEDSTYFSQCPTSFSRERLKQFQEVINTKEGKELCDAARMFQKKPSNTGILVLMRCRSRSFWVWLELTNPRRRSAGLLHWICFCVRVYWWRRGTGVGCWQTITRTGESTWSAMQKQLRI